MQTVNLSPQVLAQEELFYFVRYVFVIESVNELNFSLIFKQASECNASSEC